MVEIYFDADADLNLLKGKIIGIIGYGIQGRAQALNLRDSGLEVRVADLEGSVNWQKAVEDGMKPAATVEVAKAAQIIQILTEDHVQAMVYKTQIAPNLKEGNALVFSHGFNIHYHQILPPATVDVFMVAPKGPGALVRDMYVQGKGVPALLAIFQDFTGKAKQLGLAYAKGIGATRAGLITTTFQEETETDLFGEQAVLCGGATELIKAGFETLVEAGYQPEIAYYEVLHELKLIVDLIQTHGIQGMRKRVSDTAEFGDMTRGKRVVNAETRHTMRHILSEVQTGEFAREWILENMTGRPVFRALERLEADHPIEAVGAELRKMMPWLQK